MAANTPSPLTSSVEKTNGAKLSRLLIDGGTTVLRNVFDRYHPPASLTAGLNANYSTLNNLLRKRVIRQVQWDQLFPPSGAKPDSNSFDITLLFLLLTTICGLSPPLSGWHTKPIASDTSLEANCARIKFFRNELHGHVSTTGVNKPTFTALWQEISAVLVALGLDQAEINRLQAELCGEDDYLDMLLDWADSEQDINSQLKEICQRLTETQQDVNRVLQNKLEDRKTLEGFISKLKEVHRIETETHHENHKALHFKLDEIQQIGNETHEIAKDAHQTQLGDRKTLQEAISKLNEINQMEKQTHQVITETHQTQVGDSKTLQDTISKLDRVSQIQVETCQAVKEVHDILRSGLQEVKQDVGDFKTKRGMEKGQELLRNLTKSDFKGDIEYHGFRFQEGTREWIFKRIDDWLDDRSSNRVMVISGSPGMGKSVVSAVICKRMQDAGRLSGSHFCQHNNVRYRKPQLMIQSLASHLSYTLQEYKKALVEQLSRNLGMELNSMGVEELFGLLFKEPLSTVNDPGRNILMVIDGLDESEYQGRNELLDVIANQFSRLPQWIRLFVTTRSEINMAHSLKHLQPIYLDENQEENFRDIRLFFEKRLNRKIDEKHKNALLTKMVEKSEGVFLYAFFLIDYIQENIPRLTIEQLEKNLPLGISSVYLSHFKRLENEIWQELKISEDQVLGCLCALAASREPLPVAFVSRLLNSGEMSMSAQRKMNRAIACISSLLPVRDGRLHFFHKSVKDWLTNVSHYGQHDFTVYETKGHEVLLHLCITELDNIKRRGVNGSQFSDTEKYALEHGVHHMIVVHGLGEKTRPFNVQELVDKYVTDVELIYATLCVNNTASIEHLLQVQKHVKPAALNQQSNSLLICLLKVLRKQSYMLRDHPHLFFQYLVNGGYPNLSSRAATVLDNELSTVAYMKYLDKEEQSGAVQARFYCSDTVACLDVSPDMDYMVCECRDGTIHLWSLETGNKEWSRSSLMKREYAGVNHGYGIVSDGGAYRSVKSKAMTFYRSVVFHPNGKYILPGTLRNVYTLSGDFNDLFPKSNCIFSHCSFPSDKRMILTDCFDDPMKIALWSMETGEVLKRISSHDIISCFAISQDGSFIAFAEVTGSIYLLNVAKWCGRCLFKLNHAACELMFFAPNNEAIACGYLRFRMEYLGCHQYGWVSAGQPKFMLFQFRGGECSSHPSNSFSSSPAQDFFLWPCEPRTLTTEDFLRHNLSFCRIKNVYRVFPSLLAGFYMKLDAETSLIGSPSLKYITVVNVNQLNGLNSASTRQLVKEVVFSSEGDRIYSISSNGVGSSEVQVTVFRMTSKRLVKRSFPCPLLSLVPMKEGVVLCLKDQVPELWNFELTECVRTFTRLKGAEKLIRVSDELIACGWHRRTSTHEELSNFDFSSETGNSLEIRTEDGSVEKVGSLAREDSSDEANLSALDSSDLDISESSSKTSSLHLSPSLMNVKVVDIVNVTNGECVSSIKTLIRNDRHELFISCNSQKQLLVCTSERMDDEIFRVETLTVSVRNKNSLKHAWERSTKRYDVRPCTPLFLFSPEEEFVVTWASFNSGYGVHILDAKTGETYHTLLKDQDDIVDCKFVVNDEYLVCCSKDNFLRLFDIRSSDLLSVLDVEEQPCCLGACLNKPLVAIGL